MSASTTTVPAGGSVVSLGDSLVRLPDLGGSVTFDLSIDRAPAVMDLRIVGDSDGDGVFTTALGTVVTLERVGGSVTGRVTVDSSAATAGIEQVDVALHDGNLVSLGTLTIDGGMAALDPDQSTFATFDPATAHGSLWMSTDNLNGNAGGSYQNARSTIGVSRGKWYVEYAINNYGTYARTGFVTADAYAENEAMETDGSYLALLNHGGNFYQGSSGQLRGVMTPIYNNLEHTIGLALDLEAGKVYVAYDGVWQNGADPDAGTGGFDIDRADLGKTFYAVFGSYDGAHNRVFSANYGGPRAGQLFEDRTLDADAGGRFEYTAPAGFLALTAENAARAGAPGSSTGGDGNDVLHGTGEADSIDGGAGNDQLVGGAGADSLDGGTGSDVVVMSGAMADYLLEIRDDGALVVHTHADRVADVVRHVETLRFADGDVTVPAGPVSITAADGTIRLGGAAGVIEHAFDVDTGGVNGVRYSLIGDSDGDGVLVTDAGTVTLLTGGRFQFDPKTGYKGTTRFDYAVDDGTGLHAVGTISIDADVIAADPATATFATWDTDHRHASLALSDGNLTGDATGWFQNVRSTVGMTRGKWYMEFRSNPYGTYAHAGIVTADAWASNSGLQTAGSYLARLNDGTIFHRGSSGLVRGVMTRIYDNQKHMIGLAVDLDAGKIYVSYDGVWQNGADPDAGTGGFDIDKADLGKTFYVVYGGNDVSYSQAFSANFGGATAGRLIGPRRDDTEAGGAFVYSPPAGFFALTEEAATAVVNPGSGTGTALSDLMVGDSTDDRIDGQDGNDKMYGKAGNDTLLGGAGDDELRSGNDSDSLSGGDGSDLLIAWEGDDTASGGSGADTITGAAGADRLFGDAGADDLDGGDDNDHIEGGDGADVIDGGSGSDYLDGGADADSLIGGIGYDTLLGGTGADRLDAGGAADSLSGGAGDDYLSGGSGRDTLDGGTGDDELNGGAGYDSYAFGRGDGADSIRDSGGQDEVVFKAGIRHDQLWFARTAHNDLTVSVLGTADVLTVTGWFGAANPAPIETMTVAGGYDLTSAQVNALVTAMAAYAPPGSGVTDLSGYATGLQTAVNTLWGA